MKKALIVFVILIAVIGVYAVVAPRWNNRAKPPAKPLGPVSAVGYVVDADGKPVVGVKVYAMAAQVRDSYREDEAYQPEIKQTVVTGKGGEFEFRGLPKTKDWTEYYLIAYTSGKYLGWVHCPVEYMDRTPMCPNPYVDYRLVVHRIGKQKGRVVDKLGKPVMGAEVFVAGLVGPEEFGRPSITLNKACVDLLLKTPTVITDLKGCYELSEVPDGCGCIVGAAKPGMAQNNRLYWSPSKDIVLTLRKKQRLCEGRVLDLHGKPVVGAKVYARSNPDCAVANFATATTGPEGRYAMEYVCRDNFYAEKQGRFFTPLIGNDSSTETNDQTKTDTPVEMPDLVESRTATISGKVLEEGTGKPVSGAVVVITSAYNIGPDPWAQRAVSDPSGYYRLQVPVGKMLLSFAGGSPWYQIYPKAAKNRFFNTWVDVPESGIKEYDLDLVPAKILKGRVVDSEGAGVKGVLVSLGETPANWTRSGEGGWFEVSVTGRHNYPLMSPFSGMINLLPLRVLDKSHNRSYDSYIDPSRVRKELNVVVMPPPKVRVVVCDLQDKPVNGAVVSVDDSKSKTTDTNGYALFDDLMCKHSYSARVTKQGYLQAYGDDLIAVTGKKALPIVESGKVDKKGIHIIHVTLAPTRSVQKGKVVDADGKPVVGTVVEARFGIPPMTRFQAVTDTNGEFVLKNIPDVPVKIIAGDYFNITGSAISGPEHVVIKVRKPDFSGPVRFIGKPKPDSKPAS